MYRLSIFLIVLSCGIKQQPSNVEILNKKNESMVVLDSIISVAKEHSLYKNKVDWNDLESEMKLRLKSDSLNAIIKPVEYMFSQLEDFHGALYLYGNRYNSFYKSEYHYPVDRNVYNKINSTSSEIKGQVIDKQIAYLKIPHFYTTNQEQISEYTSQIRNTICDLKNKNPAGWIIDLRLNIGGNMYPMISGLGELFPNLKLGGDSKDGKKYHSEWYIKNGNLHMWDSPMTSSKISCNFDENNVNADKKVVFLIGRYTSSSGEAVASAFKGQKNTRLIGEITSGWSSTTGWFPITDNVLFSPTIAYFMSKDSTLHEDGVIPDDLIVEELDLDSLLMSATLIKGVEWIIEN